MARLTTADAAVGPGNNTNKLAAWINRSLEFLWLLAVVSVPLAFVKPGDLISVSAIAYIEVPKIAILRTLVGLMAVLWLIEWGIQGRFPSLSFPRTAELLNLGGRWLSHIRNWLSGQPRRWLSFAVAFFLATIVISTALSASFDVSMWGDVPGEDGYAAYTILAYVLLFAVIATHLRSRPQLWRLLGAIVLTGVLVSGYAIMQGYGYDPFELRFPSNTTRSTSTMGNATLAGSVLLFNNIRIIDGGGHEPQRIN